MPLNKISSGKIGAIGFLVCLLATLALAGLTAFTVHNLYKQNEKLQARTIQHDSLEKEIMALETFISSYKGEQDRLKEVLFSEEDIATFLENISGFAKQTGVSVVNMRTKPFVPVRRVDEDEAKPAAARQQPEQAPQAQMLSMPIDIQVEGEFQPLVDFMIHLEQSRQLVTLSDVQIKTKQYPVLDCSFTLKIYSLRDIAEKKSL